MVVAHRERRIVGIAHPKNRAVLAVVGDAPKSGLGCNQSLVAVGVVGEGLGRLGEVDLIGSNRDKVFGFFAVRGGLRQSRVCFEIGEAASGCVVEEVAAEVVRAEAECRVLVDHDNRIQIGFATHRRVAGRGTLRVLIQVVGLIGRGLGFPLLVVGRGSAAVANRVVVEVLRESGDRLTILRAAGRSQLTAGVVGVGVDGAREVAEGGAGFGDRRAATGSIVGVVELRDDVGGRRVADLKELVVRVVGPAGGEAVRVLRVLRGSDPNGGVEVVGLGTNHHLSLAQNPVLLAGQIAILLASSNRDVARLRKRRQVAALVGLEVAQRPHGVHYTIISRNPTTRTPPLQLLTPEALLHGLPS